MKMRILIYCICIVLGGGILPALAQKFNPKYLREDNKSFKALTKTATPDGWIEFKAEAKLQADNFFNLQGNAIGLSEGYQMRLLADETDASKVRHQRFQLHFRNIPVEGSEFSLHSANGEVRTAHGKIVELLDIDVNKRIGEPKALEIALADKGLTVKDFKGDNKPPVGVLLIARNQPEVVKENYVLAYQFDVFGKEDAHAIYVNAVTGEIFRRDPLTHQCFHPHTGKPSMIKTEEALTAMPHAALVASTFNPLNAARHGTNRTFETEPAFNGQGFALRFNTTQANALQTRITNQGNFAANPDLIWNNLPEVVNPNTQWGNNSQEAATAHWFGQQAFQYYSGKFGRNGINGSGNIARVIVGFDETNARWTNNTARTINMMQFGRIQTQTMATSDVYGHEYGHGITDHRGGLVPFGEAATLNEAISDIWGTSLERYTTSNWDWVLGDEFPTWAQRNMANPEATGQPATFEGPNWNPNSGPHQNTGFINRWFYLINAGMNNPLPQHNIVRPIEYEKAEKIVYGAYNYIQSSWGYADFRNATISAARDLYGECSFEMRQVQNAWQNVNLGPYVTCSTDAIDCAFTPSITVSNSNPACGASISLTANCSGQGCNPTCNGGGCTGISYDWSGQGVDPYNSGGSSKTINVPNTTGTYTYTLTANKYGYCNVKTTTININVNCGGGGSTCPNVGSISYRRWNNIGGTSIQDLRNNTNNLNNAPSVSQTLTLFEAPADIADNYGVRIRGYVCPPTTGNYTFWVAGDDNVELWLSPNDQPANLNRIAYHTGWTPSREWGWFGTQQSGPVTLQAGQRYYVEALMKEGGGGDNLAVGWQLPGGALERPIPGNRLIPFAGGGGCTPPGAPALSANPSSINSGQSSTLSATNCSGTVNWSTGATGSSITVSPGSTTTYTATCTAGGCTSSSGSVTVTVGGTGGGGCVVNKVQLQFRNVGDCCMDRLVGARIQGSNDGSNWADLYTFGSNGTGNLETYTFGNTSTYTQVRFRASATGWGEVAELKFYNGSTLLSGTAFGTGRSDNPTEYLKAFDNNTNTKWETESAGTSNVVGLILTGCGGGGCTPPGAPALSANPSSINSGQSSTLTASNCSGTVNWSTGATGSSITVSPGSTTTYTATCTAGGCTSSNGSVTVTVGGSGGGGCVVNKVQLQFRNVGDCCMDRLVGARIQGSNDGSNWADLYTFGSNGTGNLETYTFGNTSTYTQVRFRASATGWGEVAELKFYNGTTLLSGTAFGTGRSDNPTEYLKAFDNNTNTKWETESAGTSNVVGLILTGCGGGGGSTPSDAQMMEAGFKEDINGLQLFPNPSDGKITLRYYLEKGKKASLHFMTVGGSVLLRKTLTGAGGWQEDRTDLSNQPDGTYLLRFEDDRRSLTRKFMIVK